MKKYSQADEELVLLKLINKYGTTNRFCVEFGAADGVWLSNTKALRDSGWQSALFDLDPPTSSDVIKAQITYENVNQVFKRHNVPEHPDVISIDVDGQDFWIWKYMDSKYEPRYLVIEFNMMWSPMFSKVVSPDSRMIWDGSDYHGASMLAFRKLGRERGMELVAIEGCNLFFMPIGLVGERKRTPEYWPIRTHKPDTLRRKWLDY